MNKLLNFLEIIEQFIYFYSPCTFNKANPSDSPNNVIKIHVTAAVTISAFANGKICRTNAIKFKIFKFLQSFKV